MAQVNGNIFMDRLSGMIGDQMIVKKVRGGPHDHQQESQLHRQA